MRAGGDRGEGEDGKCKSRGKEGRRKGGGSYAGGRDQREERGRGGGGEGRKTGMRKRCLVAFTPAQYTPVCSRLQRDGTELEISGKKRRLCHLLPVSACLASSFEGVQCPGTSA